MLLPVLTLLSLLFSSSAHASALCNPLVFDLLLPPGAKLNYAVEVPANGTFGDNNPAFPGNATNLPELCAVSINVASSAKSSFNFALFLPNEWNGKFWTTGNGGLSGGINWQPMGVFTQYGAAAMSTDTGHLSDSGDGTWALNNPEGLIDWGYRAMHQSVVISKRVISAYYFSPIQNSYYAACSTGGRQGLKEIQKYPNDFDGIAIGAPAWWFTNLPSATVQLGVINLPETADYHIDKTLLPVIANEQIRQCDPQDGLTDGIVSDPYACKFDPSTLACGSGNTDKSACLTQPQLNTLSQIYNDLTLNDTLVYPALAKGADASFLSGDPVPAGVGLSWVQNAVYNESSWPYQDYSYETVKLAQETDAGQATADHFDLSEFRNKGGKVIMYHGLGDNLIPTGSSIYFYEQVEKAMNPLGVHLDDFYKFYLIPGMHHCSNADKAAWYIGAAYQDGIKGLTHSVPGYSDAKHDVLLALEDWVENGHEPTSIIATKFNNETVSQGVARQRPLCPYPQQAKYKGSGDADKPENWDCSGSYGAEY